MPWTFIGGEGGYDARTANPDLGIWNFPSIDVVAGDLIVVTASSKSNIAPVYVNDQNTQNSLTLRAWNWAGANRGMLTSWGIATVSTGALQIALWAVPADGLGMQMYVFRPSGGVPMLVTGREDGVGLSTGPATSGNISPAGSDLLVFGGFASDTGSFSTPLINSIAADGSITQDSGLLMLAYKTFNAGFTGAASATLSGSSRWVANTIAFNITAGAVGGVLLGAACF